MRLIAYLRVSSKGQIDGDGPERQSTAIRSFCERHGIEITDTVLEPICGDEVDRPVLGATIERIQLAAPEIDGIIVERMDRLARDLLTGELLLQQCRENGIQVYTADSGILENIAESKLTTDPTRTLIRQVLLAFAQFAKTELVKKMAIARARKSEMTNRPCGGPRFFGAESHQEFLEVRVIHKLLDRGYTPTRIAQYFRALGIDLRTHWRWDSFRIQEVDRLRPTFLKYFPNYEWREEVKGEALTQAKAEQRYRTMAEATGKKVLG
jgi:DNA invertase Pin-like site-specific DNA recombinase